jgi:hypothetical protein
MGKGFADSLSPRLWPRHSEHGLRVRALNPRSRRRELFHRPPGFTCCAGHGARGLGPPSGPSWQRMAPLFLRTCLVEGATLVRAARTVTASATFASKTGRLSVKALGPATARDMFFAQLARSYLYCAGRILRTNFKAIRSTLAISQSCTTRARLFRYSL